MRLQRYIFLRIYAIPKNNDNEDAITAIGTTLSQMTSVLFAITSIRRHRGVMDISRSDLRPQKDVIKHILKIGVPIAMQDGFIQISFLAITVIANQRGLIDAAAVGIVEKFIGLVFIVPSAMLSTVSAISAQNIGGRKYGTCQANHAHRHDDNHWLWFGGLCLVTIFPTDHGARQGLWCLDFPKGYRYSQAISRRLRLDTDRGSTD